MVELELELDELLTVEVNCIGGSTGSKKWMHCARVMTIARPFTKPSMTGCGTSVMNFPRPKTPASTCAKNRVPCFLPCPYLNCIIHVF